MSNEITPMEAMRGTLVRMESEFKAALPPQIPVDKFIRTTLTAVQMNPALLNGDRKTLLGSCMKAAQDGLLCDGREAALVMYGQNVQYLPMVGGILKKIRNSGELASISAQVVYDRDQFEYELGDNERIVHKPYLGEDRGKLIAVYAIAKTKDDAIYREVMSVSDVEKVRNSSKAKNSGPWTQWYDEMARKTVIRRIAKRLPSSADLDQVLANDNEASGFVQTPHNAPIDVTPTPDSAEGANKPSRLKKAIAVDSVDVATGEVIEQQATLVEAGNATSDN